MGRGSLNTGRGRIPSLLLLAILISPALAFSVVPLVHLAAAALVDARPAREYFSARSVETLANTVMLATATAAGASVLGCVTGLALGVAKWRGRDAFRLVLLVPLSLPPYLHAIGWTQLLRSNGLVARTLGDVFGCAPSLPTVYIQSFPGAIAVLSLAYFPLIALFTEKALALVPRSLPEAARNLGASRWRVYRDVYWPCIRPAVLSGAAIVALLTASEAGVPTLLKIRVLSFEVLTQLSAFNDVAGAVFLMAPLLVLGLFALRIAPILINIEISDRSSDAFLPLPAVSIGGWWRRMAFTSLAACIACVLPLGAIIVNALDRDAWSAMAAMAAGPASKSVPYAAAAALISVGIAVGLSAVLRSHQKRTATLVQAVLVLGFTTPSAMLGLALLRLYGHPPLSNVVAPTQLVIAALLTRYQILAYYAITSSMRQIPERMLEAAAVLGAGRWKRLVSVELPMIRIPIVVTLTCLFILGVADIGTVILLYPPGGETLMLALYSIEANSPRSYVAVLALFSSALAITPVLLVGLFLHPPTLKFQI